MTREQPATQWPPKPNASIKKSLRTKTAARQRRRRDPSAGSTAAADGPNIGPKHLTWLRRRAPKIATPTTGRPCSRDSAEPNSRHEPAGPERLYAVLNSLADREGRNRLVWHSG